MNRSIWDWLGIEPTSDKNEIKKAYSEMAKVYHPVEHPQEFQALRDAYKLALKLADGGRASYQPISTYQPRSTRQDQQESEPEYTFIKETAGNSEPEYTFNVDTEGGYNFSQRQKAMFSFYMEMLDVFKRHIQDYRSVEYFEAALGFWTKDPYKEELTADFIAALMDQLNMEFLFHPAFYVALDIILFSGRTGEEYQKQKMRLYAFKAETDLIRWKEAVKARKFDVKRMFLQYIGGISPVRLGFLFDEGFKSTPRKKFVFYKGVLFSLKNKISFCLLCDCTCTFDRRTNDISVSDVYGRKLFRMRSTHPYYHYVLEHLYRNGCNMIGAEDMEPGSHTAQFTLDAAPFHKLAFDGRFNRSTWHSYGMTVAFAIIFFLQFKLIGMDPEALPYGPFKQFLFPYVAYFIGTNMILIWGVGFFLFLFAVMSFALTCHIVGNPFMFRKLQKETNDGKVIYDLGNRIFVFGSYVVSTLDHDYIPIKNITRIEPFRKTEAFGDGYLKIAFGNGICKDYFVGYMDTAMALYEVIKKRWDAGEKEQALTKDDKRRMRQAKKYDRLRSRKKSLLKGQFLVDANVKNQYEMNIISVILSVGYTVFLIYDRCVVRAQRPLVVTVCMMILFGVMAFLFIVKFDAYLSFIRTDNELLLDACLQLKRPGIYFNMLYKISLLDDYFMSMRTGKIQIIPYKDIEWIKIEHTKTRGDILWIKAYGKEPEMFCNDQADERNSKNVSEIYGMIRYLHPEIKEFTEEKAG